ncbi:Pol polyprotein [Plakobranchus ocellatus]|uniref:Pol polyprotein n=1 Tax=Plakobranchus ocellatus TaxID=259542 RepID=A0AAV4DRC2_9GAST|nr:Pol polyprotein [Plakobranchus ocellatus]
MVERLHRQLKASLKARTTSYNWFDELPMVLLGIRSSWRVDPGCSPAELVYGSTLHIPGEFLQPHDARTVEPDLPFLRHLQQTMRSVQPPTPQFHGQPSVYVPANLAPAKFVYVRKDSHKHPLQRPYDGPYLVLNKSDKFFTVDIKGRTETISIDRLKAAFVTQLTTAESDEVSKAFFHRVFNLLLNGKREKSGCFKIEKNLSAAQKCYIHVNDSAIQFMFLAPRYSFA